MVIINGMLFFFSCLFGGGPRRIYERTIGFYLAKFCDDGCRKLVKGCPFMGMVVLYVHVWWSTMAFDP